MKIGTVEIPGNLILAPMAGVTDLPFRLLCKEQGADLVYTEMVSAKGIYYQNKNTAPLLELSMQERPTTLQLFGSEKRRANIYADSIPVSKLQIVQGRHDS